MKRSILLMIGLLAVPVAVEGQLEIGLDMGMLLNTGFETAENVTQLDVPTGSIRVGFPAGDRLDVETLLAIDYVRIGDSSGRSFTIVPGVNYSFGQSGGYLRGEAGLRNTGSSGADSETVFGLGGAVGLKKPIGNGPVSYRLEGGYLRWLANEDAFEEAYNQFRVLFGISAAVN